MQNRYAGDIGDFSKFSLLRHLGGEFSSLGLVWFLYPDEDNNDGKHIKYLDLDEFKNLDPELIHGLKQVAHSKKRGIEELEAKIHLPKPTAYFGDSLDMHQRFAKPTADHKAQRLLARQVWLVRALKAVEGIPFVCLDPDNGFEAASTANKAAKKAGKYIFFNELIEFYKGAEVLMVYDHFDRSNTHRQQMRERLRQIRELIQPQGRTFAVRFRPVSPRAYYFLTRKGSEDKVRKLLGELVNSEWGFCWDNLMES